MIIIGCDYHPGFQQIAFVDTGTGELQERRLEHREEAERFYHDLVAQGMKVRVGIEATGSMQWFLNLMEELGIECQVGHPAKIRAAEPRKQKHDRRDADLILKLLVENRFPSIWLPSKELRDLRALLLHRHQWVRMRTRVQNALQAIANQMDVKELGKSLKSSLARRTPTSTVDRFTCLERFKRIHSLPYARRLLLSSFIPSSYGGHYVLSTMRVEQ